MPLPEEFRPEVNPGVFADSIIELAPPGNRVRSYLDIVAPDDTRLNLLVHAATAYGVPHTFPVEWTQANVWCRFGIELGLVNEWRNELHRLLARIALLLRRQLPA